MQFRRNVNALRAVGATLVAPDAMAGLTEFRHVAVITYKVGATGTAVVLVLRAFGNVSFVQAFVVVQQDGRDVYPVGARHTILTVVARDGVELHHAVGRLLQESELVIAQWLQRAVGAQVVLQVFHACHRQSGMPTMPRYAPVRAA